MYTVGLVSTPAPHNVTASPKDSRRPDEPNVTTSYPTDPTPLPATFVTTPMEQLDFTLSQISPGLGVDNLQPPVSTPPPHKGTPTTAASPVATPSAYPRYESVFKSRYSATTPLSSLTIKPKVPVSIESSSSSTVYTITTPTSLRDAEASAMSAFTSVGSSLRTLDANPLSKLSTFTAASTPVSNVTTFIKTTALTGRKPSPERPLKVNIDGSGCYDNLQFETEGSTAKSNLEAWQAKQRGRYKINFLCFSFPGNINVNVPF